MVDELKPVGIECEERLLAGDVRHCYGDLHTGSFVRDGFPGRVMSMLVLIL
jgi:hypothetical protein